jgi:uncharacterized protein YbjT (DUF2867 family)
MRVIVIGGHGRTGKLVVEKLVKARHRVTATIRNPRHKGGMTRLGAESAVLDLADHWVDDFAKVFAGHDAVVFAAGSGADESSDIDRSGTIKTLRAAEQAGVKRYITISAIGASTTIPDAYKTELKDYYAAKRAGSKVIRDSRIGWTIIEPGELSDADGTGKVTLSETELELKPIPRADVAAVVAAVLAEPKTIGKTYQVVGGPTGIKKAIAATVESGGE